MAKYKGRNFLVQRGSGSPIAYVTIGGLRSTSMTINNESVDVTDKNGSGWRELLEGAGITSMSIKGAGVFSDNAAAVAMQTAAVANTLVPLKLISDAGDSFTGTFQITAFERGGEHNKEETFSVTLESAGTITHA